MPAEIDWHARFQQQALWTKSLRDFIYPSINLKGSRRILDVGCGTGALLEEIEKASRASVHGLDLNRDHLSQARQHRTRALLTQGDALHLPYRDHAFDIALCHFVLLWVRDSEQMVREMKRVTRPGGYVLALAEPDYGGRIDYPPALDQLGKWQETALTRQGADPEMGRKLADVFYRAGFHPVQTGLLGGQWTLPQPPSAWESEWSMLEADLATIPDLWDRDHLNRLKAEEISARQLGKRILYVPTFYAWARVD